MALLTSGDEVLIPDNAYGPSKDLARHELARWGITHALLRPDWTPTTLAAAISAGDQAGLARGSRLGDDGVSRPAQRSCAPCASVRRRPCVALDNTWGAGLAFDAFDLGQGQGVDITIHALTKYPSGGGDVLMGSVTTRDEALHLQAEAAAHAHRLGRRRQRRRGSCCVRCRRCRCATRRRTAPAARFGALVQHARPRSPACCTRRCPARPATRTGKSHCRAAAGLFSVDVRRALRAGAGRCLRRCAAAVSHRLLLGRADQPGRAVRRSGDARPANAVPGSAGALLDSASRPSTT